MDRAVSLEMRRIDLTFELPFQLGRVRVDPPAHEYAVDGTSIRMQPQTLKVLIALHDKIGQVVTRDELIQRCWDSRIVGEDVINRCISMLRRLAEKSGGFQIETVPRAGYRLVELPAVARVRRRYPWIAGIGVAVAGSIMVAFLLSRHQVAAPANIAVEVLPFTVEHGSSLERAVASDARDSVGRMLTESGVLVKTARDENGQLPDSIDLVVAGHVNEQAHAIVATVTVEEGRRHAIILSHQLEADHAHPADLTDQIGANVAGSLSWAGRLIRVDEQHSSDPAAVSQMLDQFSNEEFNFWRTYEFARRHAPTVPDSAVAQWQLAIVTGLLMHGLPITDRPDAVRAAITAADRARALEPQFGDFFVPWCVLHPPVRLLECEDHLRAGIATDPQAAWAPSFLGHLMNNVGRTGDAVVLDGTSLAADSYAPAKIAQLIMMYEARGASSRAQDLFARGTRLWPHKHVMFRLRMQGITERGDFKAVGQLEQQVGAANLPPFYDSALGLAQAVMARSVSGAKAACPKTSIDQKIVQCMLAFAQLGDLDDSFAYADEVYPQRWARTAAQEVSLWFADPFVLDTSFLAGRGAAPMRRDPRYLILAQRLGLLDYWRSGRLPDFCTEEHEPVCKQIVAATRRKPL